ncbi:16S rRNA (uracil(1498)-N(3))-methyltransferase [Nocardioides marmoribigeumensis]|uniref:Ribosomal RNA small subunit methyltransferase E n=1 Tax=Nocardioides marmoribigeumensis TaxID=433649 RepID=A0ABU2C0U0_9ACTN|nr:16S rRNA (uracil(1498)-N(3))-methyltransferase [Nocardioides marmoribigeumensis]MDR7364281.1 16S rRNA (uracil1498-N3)-methyltransferase [Nocardioides marmoribigeumensis]
MDLHGLPVFLLEGAASVAEGDSVVLDGPEGHHAAVVRRLAVGEGLVLTDGAGTRLVGTVAAVAKRSLTVEVSAARSVPRPTPSVTVVQAVPKGERGELAVELLTEVGADVVVPFAAERSIGRWRGERVARSLEKWRSTAREAAKQSRRAWWPAVTEPAGLDEVCDRVRSAGLALVLHEGGGAPLASVVPQAGLPEDLLLVVGPEGGLSDAEVEVLRSAGAAVVRLGEEVLRTSTAGAAATAALLAHTPRWGAPPPEL